MAAQVTTRRTAARAILSDFRQWYARKYGTKKIGKKILSKQNQVTAK